MWDKKVIVKNPEAELTVCGVLVRPGPFESSTFFRGAKSKTGERILYTPSEKIFFSLRVVPSGKIVLFVSLER